MRFWTIRIILFLLFFFLEANVFASAFQVWNQDAVSVGNAGSGRAAEANDASTSFYNPAGLIRIKNQQFVVGAAPIFNDLRFNGTVSVNTLANSGAQGVSVQGGTYNFIPFVHYAAPINDHWVFGLSFTKPFSLKTDYGSATNLRYISRLDYFDVYDLSPALAYAWTDKFSMGIGWDIERINGDFNSNISAAGQTSDTLSNNTGHGQAFGYHVGILYQWTPSTRVGVNYSSQVVHHIEGSSYFIGPLASSGFQANTAFQTRVILPPVTTFSLFHTLNKRWDLLISANYTEWNVTNNITLNNVVGFQNGSVVNNLQSTLVQHYQDTWDYAVGANYHLNDQWLLRAGVGYDESPVRSQYRNVAIPDSNRISIGLGTHFQATETLGVDLGWIRYFAMNTRINNLSQSLGSQTVVTNGSIQQNTDVYGLQLKWDIL